MTTKAIQDITLGPSDDPAGDADAPARDSGRLARPADQHSPRIAAPEVKTPELNLLAPFYPLSISP
jgi:hypothetical protein